MIMMGGKYIFIIGAVAVALLLVSSATAVPQINSTPIMESIREREQINSKFMLLTNLKKSEETELGKKISFLFQKPLIQIFFNKVLNYILEKNLNIENIKKNIYGKELIEKKVIEIEKKLSELDRIEPFKPLTEKLKNQLSSEEFDKIHLKSDSLIDLFGENYDEFIELLTLICMMLISISLLLFGHNEGGVKIAVILCYIILLPPLELIWIIGAPFLLIFIGFSAFLTEFIQGMRWLLENLKDAIYDSGIIGILFAIILSLSLVFLSPIIMILWISESLLYNLKDLPEFLRFPLEILRACIILALERLGLEYPNWNET